MIHNVLLTTSIHIYILDIHTLCFSKNCQYFEISAPERYAGEGWLVLKHHNFAGAPCMYMCTDIIYI